MVGVTGVVVAGAGASTVGRESAAGARWWPWWCWSLACSRINAAAITTSTPAQALKIPARPSGSCRCPHDRAVSRIGTTACGGWLGVPVDWGGLPAGYCISGDEGAVAEDLVVVIALDSDDLSVRENALHDPDVHAVADAAAVEHGVAGRGPSGRRQITATVGCHPGVDGSGVGVGLGSAGHRDAGVLPHPGDEQRAPLLTDRRVLGAVRPGRMLALPELTLS